MKATLQAITEHAVRQPSALALAGHDITLDFASLKSAIELHASTLRQLNCGSVALHADNSPEWIVADLALLASGIPCIPLPLFFSAEQRQHVINSSGIDTVITDQPEQWQSLGASLIGHIGRLSLLRLDCAVSVPVHEGTAKITFTSGSTGQPKGVCLPASTMDAVAASLAEMVVEMEVQSHLCLLPLPILLENVAGVYCGLQAGIGCHIPPLKAVGLAGSQGLDLPQMLETLNGVAPDSVILLPQVLKSLVAAVETGALHPKLKLAAVGGARVSAALVARARAQGIPVYEGYGLSECGSVVAVNKPQADKPGSVGHPLPHVRLNISPTGEVLVDGPHYLGYLGGPPLPPGPIATGDLGILDDQGFLHINGRSKHLIITSYGRNISPEWVEGELLAQTGILQCVVYGEARPHLSALVVAPGLSDQALSDAIEAANRRLPDYARVLSWLRADAPFSPHNRQLTNNGRPVRTEIFLAYASRLDALYVA